MKMLTLNEKDSVATITLNRPELHNAFNAQLITEATELFQSLGKKDLRLVVLKGAGKSFCAGADLNWMSSMKSYSEKENFEDSKKLAGLFKALNEVPCPVIGRVNGHALGGGAGLVACCDYVIASSTALFGFTEVKLGLIPAVISPFVLSKIGESNARAWFLSGERFDALTAKNINLVHEVVEPDQLDAAVAIATKRFLGAGPIAAREAKALIFKIRMSQEVEDETCQRIARLRISPEGQDGMQALLTKSKPKWIKS